MEEKPILSKADSKYKCAGASFKSMWTPVSKGPIMTPCDYN